MSRNPLRRAWAHWDFLRLESLDKPQCETRTHALTCSDTLCYVERTDTCQNKSRQTTTQWSGQDTSKKELQTKRRQMKKWKKGKMGRNETKEGIAELMLVIIFRLACGFYFSQKQKCICVFFWAVFLNSVLPFLVKPFLFVWQHKQLFYVRRLSV